MRKISLFFLPLFLFASEEKIVEVYAKNVEQNATTALIHDEIEVHYDGKVLYANDGIYRFKQKKLFLKGDVKIIDPLEKKTIYADSLDVEFDTEKILFKKFFEIDKEDVWVKAQKAIKQKEKIDLENAIFSSCKVKTPDWKIVFSKAKYDLKEKKLKLYDAKVYIKKFPIFYLPYLPLNLSKERRSGFLTPTFDYSEDEGFAYSQPYFWAISKSQDLEITPQIRTQRGYGIYSTYRFVDTKYSFGKIRVGYFKDLDSFTKEHNLKYNKHYGVEIYYRNKNLLPFLTQAGYKNALYINALQFNDTEYLNLQFKDKMAHHKVGSFYESRVNFFLQSESFYAGAYLKYFKDTTKSDNSSTLQILPELEFATSYKSLIANNFYYKAIVSLSNYTRDEGSKALKLKFQAPLEFHISLFNDFVSFNATEEIEATGYDFYNVPIEQKKYSSLVLNSKVNLSTELIKNYKNATHIVELGATYIKSQILSQDFMKYEEIPDDLKSDFVDDIPFDSKIDFRLHQYWFSQDLKIDHIVDLDYYFNDNKFRDLHQEFKINYKNWFFNSNIRYSFLHSQTTDINNKIGYNGSKFGLWLGFLWKKDYLSLETVSKELQAGAYYNYNSNLKFDAKIAYNIKDTTLKEWRVHSFYKRKCWSLDFTLGQDIRPVIKSDGSRGSISNNFVQFQVTILPFGQSFGN